MSETLRFDNRVAVITGAGGGLGRAYALLLASRGARIVVNDLGGDPHGQGADMSAADRVVKEIKEADGIAVASYDSVEDGEKIVQAALDNFGRIDIVINNAGILRDVSFHKMKEIDWDLIYRVHLYGAFKVTHAAWPHFRQQEYGRVIMTASAAGLYGNFGQVNYGAVKLGLLGMANTLAIEGKKRHIQVNTIAPIAGSRLTETVLPADLVAALKPEYVAPLVAYLCHESCAETGGIFELGAGWISRLRWQRSKGAFFPLSRPITPEQVAANWSIITDFEQADTPTSVQDAFGPIMSNLSPAASAPGNEFVNLDLALGHELKPESYTYTKRDAVLYALSVGAASDPLDSSEWQFVNELNPDGFRTLPTFGVTFPFVVTDQIMSVPGLKFNPMMLLHGEQVLELKRPLPSEATLIQHAHISQIYDKGKGALVIVDVSSRDEQGEEVVFNQSSLFIRGIGNFGGQRGPAGDVNQPPDRLPDAVYQDKTSENQAFVYRLASGDRNPLHVDPAMAAIGGFERPILHGLCTFGFAGRAVLKQFAANDSTRFRSMKVRFSHHVFPGETIVTEMWRESDNRIIFQARTAERRELVLTNGVFELFPSKEIAPAESAMEISKSQVVFEQIDQRIAEHPEWTKQVGVVYQFHITGNEGGQYVVDLKNEGGGARPGKDTAAACTLILTYEDFMAMLQGQLNPQLAFMRGKLKIKGNVMLAAKLSPLFS
jgi:3-hydroxyacyl-CoA dehydrogenase/3a,7a,12a-trihydroxy-5b-cholest-24-enoyl-CoA hydratase